MPDPRDGQCGKMPHYCPGGGGGMGTTGFECCIILPLGEVTLPKICSYRAYSILRNPGAVSRVEGIFVGGSLL